MRKLVWVLTFSILGIGCGGSAIDFSEANRFATTDSELNSTDPTIPIDDNPIPPAPTPTPTPEPTPTPTPSADTTPPSIPGSFATALATNGFHVDMTWTASSDNVGISHYKITRVGGTFGDVEFDSISGTSFTDVSGLPSTNYSYSIEAIDTSGNVSPSSPGSNITLNPDTENPTAPGSLHLISSTSTSITIGWNGSSDNHGIKQYHVYKDGVSKGSVFYAADPPREYRDTAVSPAIPYEYHVVAEDWTGNLSAASSTLSVTAPGAPDTTPPSDPTGLIAQLFGTSVAVQWTGSTDNLVVAGYNIYRKVGSGTYALLSSSPLTISIDSSVVSGETYYYTVRAYDWAGNESGNSNESSPVTIP